MNKIKYLEVQMTYRGDVLGPLQTIIEMNIVSNFTISVFIVKFGDLGRSEALRAK